MKRGSERRFSRQRKRPEPSLRRQRIQLLRYRRNCESFPRYRVWESVTNALNRAGDDLRRLKANIRME